MTRNRNGEACLAAVPEKKGNPMIGIDKGITHGLMAFWANIPLENEMAFLEWHNTEHIPERVAIPGFALGRRYRVAADPFRFLMCYDTRDTDVLVSKPYLEALNSPTRRTREALTWFRAPLRNLYSLESEWGELGPTASPILATVRIDADEGGNEPAARPVDPARIAAAATSAASGISRVAIYRVDPAGAGVATGERAIHGAAAQETGTLIWIETSDLRLREEPDHAARFEQALQPLITEAASGRPVHFELAWLDFVDLPKTI